MEIFHRSYKPILRYWAPISLRLYIHFPMDLLNAPRYHRDGELGDDGYLPAVSLCEKLTWSLL